MSSKDDGNIIFLKSILEKIDASVGETSLSGNSAHEISDAVECMRLWFAIRTDDGRKRALDYMSRIVEDEQR